MKNKLAIVGAIISLTGLIMAWLIFDWKLALVFFLVIWGNNIEFYSKLLRK